MLWRANLYIDEGSNDWNNMHPWNVPASSSIVASDKTKEWWNADWGYNEWNKIITTNGYDSDIVLGTPEKKISGKQVVVFSDFSWTPVRTQEGATSSNYKNNTVAYDYMSDIDGIRAWDSPFDFIYKMHEQRRTIRKHFSLFNGDDAPLIAEFPSGIGSGIIEQKLKNKDLSEWKTTQAPNNQWKYYWKEPVDENKAYIPGLGLRLYDKKCGGTTELFTVPGTDLEFTDKASAGADCVGFAQRSASYVDNEYAWTAIGGGFPTDRAEGNANPDDTARSGRATIPRNYDGGNKSNTIFKRGVFDDNRYFTNNAGKKNAPSLTVFKNTIRPDFLRIVPGDVIWYEGDHIGIVCEVDTEAMRTALSIYDLMRDVKVIEIVYSGSVNYVHKRNMLQGDGANFTEDTNYSWHKGKDGELRNWFIERLVR